MYQIPSIISLSDLGDKQWMAVTDVLGTVFLYNPKQDRIVKIGASGISGSVFGGLRRNVYEETANGYKELPVRVLMDERVAGLTTEFYSGNNSWNFDWPHLQREAAADADPSMEQRIIEAVYAECSVLPFDFEIVGLQRRHLLYFSDGDISRQGYFQGLCPKPQQRSPFNPDGSLVWRYQFQYNSLMRDSKAPQQDRMKVHGQSNVCMLYEGPAWVMRFTLDGQVVLLENNRMYLDDEGKFKCTDWCQRHDFTSYSGGINLQQSTFDIHGWIMGPLINYLQSHGNNFKPKKAGKVQQFKVRELVSKAPAVASAKSFEDHLKDSMTRVEQAYKAKGLAIPTIVADTRDVPPITAKAVLEAEAAVADDIDIYRMSLPSWRGAFCFRTLRDECEFTVFDGKVYRIADENTPIVEVATVPEAYKERDHRFLREMPLSKLRVLAKVEGVKTTKAMSQMLMAVINSAEEGTDVLEVPMNVSAGELLAKELAEAKA